jgi:hypothetical protein
LNVGLKLGEVVAESVDKEDDKKAVGVHRAHIHYARVKVPDGDDSVIEIFGRIEAHF